MCSKRVFNARPNPTREAIAEAALRLITDDHTSPAVGSLVLKDRASGSTTASNEQPITVEVTATDDIVVGGYLLTSTDTAPSPSAAGWSTTPPTSYVLPPGAGVKTVYAWAKDLAGNVSPAAIATIALDPVPPTVTVTVPSMTRSTNVNVTVTASDNVGVAAYLVSSLASKPGENDPRWQPQPPTSIRVPIGDGVKRVFGWTRDTAGNVSRAARLLGISRPTLYGLLETHGLAAPRASGEPAAAAPADAV